ncbi:MAG: 3-isopropylmalate dehydrogenase [Alistipes sp.]|jgi:3-isopropylmalate dehydrogenase|nr:3-isopropylmalate dehydrogenase [Alistipes sp.]
MEYKIALLAGDGIGPEITAEAVKVLDAVGSRFGHSFVYTRALVGGAAIDECGDPYPAETDAICKAADAILFGAIGHPRFDNDPSAKVRPEQGLLRMRRSLGLFANIRPVEIFEALVDRSPLRREVIEGADFVVVRDLTGGLYFGERGRNADGDAAFDTCTYTRTEVDRILRKGFEMAGKRRGRLTVVDKANVLETSRLWRERARALEKEYPTVTVDYMFVDNAAMQIVTRPSAFDVVVTENMFGDILTDEASVITGSLGMLPSASVGTEHALCEPIHGSYPQAAGRNIANPMATILSAAMMLDHLGLSTEAAAVRSAVNRALEAGVVTEDIAADSAAAVGTSVVGDYLCAAAAAAN